MTTVLFLNIFRQVTAFIIQIQQKCAVCFVKRSADFVEVMAYREKCSGDTNSVFQMLNVLSWCEENMEEMLTRRSEPLQDALFIISRGNNQEGSCCLLICPQVMAGRPVGRKLLRPTLLRLRLK